jgi:hypothetical protein
MATPAAASSVVDPDATQDQIPGKGPGETPMTPGAIAGIAIYLFLIALGLLVGLYFTWSAYARDQGAQRKPAQSQGGTIEPSQGPIAGGTVVKITGAKAFTNPVVHFDGVEVKPETVGDANNVLRAVAPRHDARRVIVDVVDKTSGKTSALLSYTYGSPFNPLLFLLVVLAGGLGASLHALRSLYWYAGNRKLVWSWQLMYLLLPWTGALMATVFYLVISAGLMTPEQASNPLIAVGIAVLVGMFSREAAEKLESIADSVLTKASNGADAGKDSQKVSASASGQAAAPAEIYVQQGSTTHFDVHYAQSLGDDGPTLADAVLATCEADYERLHGWFGSKVTISRLPFNIYIKPGTKGAEHATCLSTDIYCDAFNGTDADLVRSLVVAEADEVFMAEQDKGWDCGGSNGEALSRVLAAEIYPNELTPPGTGVTFATGADWLDSADRPDFVNKNDSTDQNFVSIGCGTLFINWLRFQLNYRLDQIVQAGGPTLADTYTTLTNGQTNGFDLFSSVLAKHYPPGTPSGLTNDNPFPLS